MLFLITLISVTLLSQNTNQCRKKPNNIGENNNSLDSQSIRMIHQNVVVNIRTHSPAKPPALLHFPEMMTLSCREMIGSVSRGTKRAQ